MLYIYIYLLIYIIIIIIINRKTYIYRSSVGSRHMHIPLFPLWQYKCHVLTMALVLEHIFGFSQEYMSFCSGW